MIGENIVEKLKRDVVNEGYEWVDPQITTSESYTILYWRNDNESAEMWRSLSIYITFNTAHVILNTKIGRFFTITKYECTKPTDYLLAWNLFNHD